MPATFPTPCRAMGCPLTTSDGSGYCLQHAHLKRDFRRQRRDRKDRPSAHQRGYTAQWQKARRLYLNDHPLCAICSDRGLITAAQVVDHIEPHKGDPLKFWNRDNWQALCKRCHDRKTASERDEWY